MRRGAAAALVAFLSAALLAGAQPTESARDKPAAPMRITVDATKRRQTIEGLGATATGTWYPQIKPLYLQQAFADRLRDDLGISIVRLEIPPEIQAKEDPDPGSLDVSRFDFGPLTTAGTLAVNLNRGHEGAVKVIGSIWSPPAWMKESGVTTGGGAIRADRLPHFAKYCAAISREFPRAVGVPLYALGPQNEPAFKEEYNSCEYTPERYRDMMAAIDAAFAKWAAGSKVYGPEDVGTDPARWLAFVTGVARSKPALPCVHAWAIHSYPWQGDRDESNPEAWSALLRRVQPFGKPIWVTEVSGEDPSWLGTPENPKGALALACQIHEALVDGEAAAYVYWAIADPAPSKFALMDRGTPTKKYHAARQFFRFIRPGAVRVETSGAAKGVSTSAFVHDEQRTVTVVLINRDPEASAVELLFAGIAPTGKLKAVRSSAADDSSPLEAVAVTGGAASLTLPGQSVTTLVGTVGADHMAPRPRSGASP
jgi:O-glycosyl hydrolase